MFLRSCTCADESFGTGETPDTFVAEGAVCRGYEGGGFERVGFGACVDISYRAQDGMDFCLQCDFVILHHR